MTSISNQNYTSTEHFERRPCEACLRVLPSAQSLFPHFSKHVLEPQPATSQQLTAPHSSLLRQAFSSHQSDSDPPKGVKIAVENALFTTDVVPGPNVAHAALAPYYYRKSPNCVAVAVTSGIRGMVVGTVFGAAIGLSSAVQSGFRGGAAFTYAGQGALRNAAAFGSWTAVYGFTRCGLIRLRGRDDMFNAATAGGFTGGLLTFISVRGYWRYNQSAILTNAAASAMIACMFNALNQF